MPPFKGSSTTQSIGESTYEAMTLQFTRRFNRGIQ
jgi:hypothetical protein